MQAKNMLLGYHYALRHQSKQLARERSEIQKRKDSAIAASTALHKARSEALYTNSKRHSRHRSRVENLEHSERRSLSKDTRSSACGSTNVSVHNTAKSRRSKGTYAPGRTARIKNGRQQVDSKKRGGISQ
jgi:hypothetical protein